MAAVIYSCFLQSLNVTCFIIVLVLLEPYIKKHFSAVCLYRLFIILLLGMLLPIRITNTNALFCISLPQTTAEDKSWNDNAENDNAVRVSNDFGKEKENILQQEQLTQSTSDDIDNNRQGNRTNSFDKFLSVNAYFVVRNLYLFIAILWGFGVILLTLKGISFYRYLIYLKRFLEPLEQEDFIEDYHNCIRELHFHKRKELMLYQKSKLYKCSVIKSPMTIGAFKPIILLPNEEYTKKEFNLIIRHELIHIRRGDSVIKLMCLIMLSLNWYNPLCYLLSKRLDEWCEASCDELVLHNSTRSDCLSYCKLLLRYTLVKKDTSSFVNMIGGKDYMRNRLNSIIEYRKKRSGILSAILFLCIMLTTVIIGVNNNVDVLASNEKKALVEQPTEDSIEEVDNRADLTETFDINNNASIDKTEATDNNNDSSTDPVVLDQNLNSANKNAKSGSTAEVLRKAVVENAILAQSVPYLWGGNDLNVGVDSSGYVQAIYNETGYELPRTSREQASQFDEVSLDSLEPGDLIFYGIPDEDEINHVAIYIGDQQVIHASNMREGIKISELDYRPILGAARVITD